MGKKILCHRSHTLGYKQSVFNVCSLIMWFGYVSGNQITCYSVRQSFSNQIIPINPSFTFVHLLIIVEEVKTIDLACCKISVLNPLAHIVLVDRFTEVAEIVGCDLRIRLRFFSALAEFKLAWGCGEPDLHGLGV